MLFVFVLGSAMDWADGKFVLQQPEDYVNGWLIF